MSRNKRILLGSAFSSGGIEEKQAESSEAKATDSLMTDASLGGRCSAGFICLESIYVKLIHCS